MASILELTKNVSKSFWSIYTEPRMIVLGLIGFSSGVPLLLTSSTLGFYLHDAHGISLTHIGLFGLATLPYVFKFAWAPLVDRLKLPFLTRWMGRRRGWLLFSQVNLLIGLWSMALIDPSQNLVPLALLSFYVCFSSATQDIVMLAYQAERLGINQYGAGEAIGIFGYRMGMLAANAGAFHMANIMDWPTIYMVLSLAIIVGIITTFCCLEPNIQKSPEVLLREEKADEFLHSHSKLPKAVATLLSWLYGAVVCPFIDFIQKRSWFAMIMLMIFYKLGDHLIGTMSNIFYTDLGFTKTEIANASKTFGMFASVLGSFAGGMIIRRLGMLKSLLFFGLLHGGANLMYVVMANVGHNLPALYISIFLENTTGGMRTVALFAYQLTLCNVSYAATQLAILTSAVHFGRTAFSSLSGWLAEQLDWEPFFYVTCLGTIPSLMIVWHLARQSGENLFDFKSLTVLPLRR